MTEKIILPVIIFSIVLVSLGAQEISAFSFMNLGDLEGGDITSGAYGVSSDGSIVVGDGVSIVVGNDGSIEVNEAFLWTSDVMVGLGDLPEDPFFSRANAVSDDGSIVVGFGKGDPISFEAFRWTAAGMVGLGDLEGGTSTSVANDISADGSVIVGSSNFNPEAFRWTADGMVGLGVIPSCVPAPELGKPCRSFGHAVSADGSVVVGVSTNQNHNQEAFRWTSDGMVGLGDLPGGDFNSVANAVSADGLVVVGKSDSCGAECGVFDTEAFRWTSAGMVGLGDLPGGNDRSEAYDASADGSVVVGFSHAAFANGNRAFIWDSDNGIQDLNLVLTNAGVDLDGFVLNVAHGVSDDGCIVVGASSKANHGHEAFLVDVCDVDTDGDGTLDALDDCPNDPNKTAPGINGCGVSDIVPVQAQIDTLKSEVNNLLIGKDAKKLTKKLDKLTSILTPPDETEINLGKLLAETDKLLDKGKISPEDHTALVTAIQSGDIDTINETVAGLTSVSDKDLKKLKKILGIPDIGKACKELDGFIKEANKLFSKGKLSDATSLISSANNIKDGIGC